MAKIGGTLRTVVNTLVRAGHREEDILWKYSIEKVKRATSCFRCTRQKSNHDEKLCYHCQAEEQGVDLLEFLEKRMKEDG